MRNFFIFISLMMSAAGFGQNISSGKWADLFSYNNVLAMKADGNRIVAATENGIFYYDTVSGEISKLSKANGLHEVKVSAFDYNPDTKCGLVGYVSGAMDLITPKGISYIVDIPIATSYTGSKKINHIAITGNKAAIATGYGVSIYNIDSQGFGDTAFFSTGSSFNPCNAGAISGNIVYAATADGLRSHKLDPADPTLPIYSSWQTILPGNFVGLAANDTSVAAATKNAVFLGSGTNFSQTASFSSVKDIALSGQNFAVSEDQTVTLLNLAGVPVKTFSAQERLNTAIAFNGKILAGSVLSGILDEGKKSYKPDGPYNNKSYKIFVKNGKIWVSTGARDAFNNASPDAQNLGFYYYTGSEWVYPNYFKTNQFSSNPIVFNILDVTPNPSDYGEVFFTNYSMAAGQGIYNMKWDKTDFVLNKKFPYDANPSLTRPVGCTYGDQGKLFCTFAKMEQGQNIGIGVYDGAQFLTKSINVTEGRVQKAVFSDGLLWIPVPGTSDGSTGHVFLAYNDHGTPTSLSDDDYYILAENNGLGGNIRTISAAPDNDGDIWIGTNKGLRILSNASSEIKNPDAKVQPVIITQNGLGEELFRDAAILQIETDSGNQKWVSINDGGVFYLSADGQQTREHFTKANSPLPNDDVTDIKVDEQTGKVYFVTTDGIVVYQGDAQGVSSSFGNVLVYPNPVVYSNFKGNVKIRGLADTTNIRITDAAGNLVHQAVARGGFYEWDLNNFRGNRVASGIYFVLMTNADGTDKATAKIAVVN